MNTQEILPEPIDQPGEKLVEAAESVDTMNEEQASKMVEQQPGAVAGGAALSGAHLSSAQSQVGGLAQASIVSSDDSSQGSQATAHLSADDLDLIEKEWVKKAKEIVDATQNDPRIQSDELSKVKADYIKKRYGKDVKVKEG